MAHILVAESTETSARIRQIVSGHKVDYVTRMSAAIRILEEHDIDLVICTVDFDDTNILQLLQIVKNTPKGQRTPFVCARVNDNTIRSPISQDTLKYTCMQLGSTAFLNIADYEKEPERQMAYVIQSYLEDTTSKTQKTNNSPK